MKHNSLADFTNKVTSKDLPNITIIRITCVTLFGKVTLFPFVSVLKVVCPLLAKSQKVSDTACKIEKIRENTNVLHAAIWYLPAACKRDADILMGCCKRLSVTLWIPLHAESANCMQRRSCFAIYRTDKSNQNIKMETINHPRLRPYHFQANLIWCDGTFKSTGN